MPKLKILCLHGYRQDVKAFQTKSGGFRKLLKNCQFEYVAAPHIIPEGEQNPEGSSECLSWWFSAKEPDYFKSTQVSDYVKGFDESLAEIEKTFAEKGPFDGILGFSQGGSMVGLVCALKQLGEFKYDFKFAILIASFKSLTAKHSALFDCLREKKITIPTLHIVGDDDQVVRNDVSLEFAEQFFHNPAIVRHPKGHCCPSDSSLRPKYEQFLKDFIVQ